MRSALLAIIAAVMVVSCESATAPEPVAPESSSDLLDLGKLLKKILPPPPEDGGDEDGGDEEDGRDGEDSRDDEDEDGTGSSELTFVVESAPGPAKLVSGVFSVLGGVLSVDEHGIAVPRGALVRPTLFTMQTVAGPVIDVDLNAFESGLLNRTLSRVGLFNKAVTLELSYASATNVADPSRLVIVRLHEDDGRIR
jgi:hypothetical protein